MGKRQRVDPIPGPDLRGPVELEPVPGRTLAFRAKGQARDITMIPLNRLFGQHYAVYWKVLRNSA